MLILTQKKATTIDVIGKSPNSVGVAVELHKKGDPKFYRRIDINRAGNYKVSFSLRGLKSGLYDVKVIGGWAHMVYRAELQHYLKVIR
ncbi:hypothetical protein [Listeria aquatica]|uniref:Uncharacterized protein n=1 Tax=Listeria aquatica FSL S10-1188 TaxID=1265818 RepID=W7B522_9LIST|nr:hypothetical protein [Listeria aquatica]EUJ17836.1 hypothetical protein MAQA_12626 [Listeria aquatica FSL S10-1188]